MDFEKFKYKKDDIEKQQQPLKKKKMYHYDSFLIQNPNILVFFFSNLKIVWKIADPGGTILVSYEWDIDDVDIFENILKDALLNECTVVTHDKDMMCKRMQIDATGILYTMELSSNRYGVVRLDNRKKKPNIHEMHSIFGQSAVTDECTQILNSFIQGRMNGWW